MRNNKEVWKPVNEFEMIYGISSLGRLKNLKTKKIINGTIHWSGYVHVILRKDNPSKTNKIFKRTTMHKLVAEHFLDNPHNHPEIDHLDKNVNNNKISNLEWVSLSENRKRKNNKNNGGKGVTIKVFNYSGETIGTYKSINEVCKNLKLNHKSITMCLNGKFKSTGGYTFKRIQ